MKNIKISTNGLALILALLSVLGINATDAQLLQIDDSVGKVIEAISAVVLALSVAKMWINQIKRPDIKNFLFKIK